MTKPLEGILVLDFCQYLAGPSAALRLADLGARVIKIERPGTGDGSRHLVLEGCVSDGDAVNFHTINRNKESIAVNTKDPQGLAQVKRLIAQADVLIESFRPGVMEKLGLGYEAARALNPRLVYASISGYGAISPWAAKPGQDLLVQSLSGLAWLNGNDGQPPMPFALSLADSYTGVHAAEGILACLARREETGAGGHVEVSLLASIIDLQFEVITTYLNDGRRAPQRSAFNNAHAYLAAPYGIYATADGHIALAMGSVAELGRIIGSERVAGYDDPSTWFTRRDEIKRAIADVLATETTAHWLELLEKHDYWCSDVYTWEKLVASDAFAALDCIQDVARTRGEQLLTTRCPITFAGEDLGDSRPAPRLGEHMRAIIEEFNLDGADGPNKAAEPITPSEIPSDEAHTCSTVTDDTIKPLAGITVLDLSQFLSAPSATLRLADLGARVIKVERPGTGDICRTLYISDCDIDGDSSLFHAINRNKHSIALDLKDPASRPVLERLVRKADVMVVNYRPGVAERLGVDYTRMSALNPTLVYGEVSGYGTTGPWVSKPGQDLLAQALSGICWLNGNADMPPTPMGLSIGDLFAGQHLAQGILAGVLRARRCGKGAHVQVNLLASLLDAQFEVFTTWLNDGHRAPQRSAVNNANAYIDAPYGIYATSDGHIALAMVPIPRLGELIGCADLCAYTDPETWHTRRDEIKTVLAAHLANGTTAHWLSLLEPADVWCSDVYTWDKLMETDAFAALDMLQVVERENGARIGTTRCPITIDGERPGSPVAAPTVGQHDHLYR